jgi:hypothetical protein
LSLLIFNTSCNVSSLYKRLPSLFSITYNSKRWFEHSYSHFCFWFVSKFHQRIVCIHSSSFSFLFSYQQPNNVKSIDAQSNYFSNNSNFISIHQSNSYYINRTSFNQH